MVTVCCTLTNEAEGNMAALFPDSLEDVDRKDVQIGQARKARSKRLKRENDLGLYPSLRVDRPTSGLCVTNKLSWGDYRQIVQAYRAFAADARYMQQRQNVVWDTEKATRAMQQHRCTSNCIAWHNPSVASDVYICALSGNMHMCTSEFCTMTTETDTSLVCTMTGRRHPLPLCMSFDGMPVVTETDELSRSVHRRHSELEKAAAVPSLPVLEPRTAAERVKAAFDQLGALTGTSALCVVEPPCRQPESSAAQQPEAHKRRKVEVADCVPPVFTTDENSTGDVAAGLTQWLEAQREKGGPEAETTPPAEPGKDDAPPMLGIMAALQPKKRSRTTGSKVIRQARLSDLVDPRVMKDRMTHYRTTIMRALRGEAAGLESLISYFSLVSERLWRLVVGSAQYPRWSSTYKIGYHMMVVLCRSQQGLYIDRQDSKGEAKRVVVIPRIDGLVRHMYRRDRVKGYHAKTLTSHIKLFNMMVEVCPVQTLASCAMYTCGLRDKIDPQRLLCQLEAP